jgi:hypothetical protein
MLRLLLLLLPPARRLGARLSRARGCGARGDGAVVIHLVAVRRKLLLLRQLSGRQLKSQERHRHNKTIRA